jgi:hypothetical protein
MRSLKSIEAIKLSQDGGSDVIRAIATSNSRSESLATQRSWYICRNFKWCAIRSSSSNILIL